ncbi:MAG TPA: amino acid ABC transporter substrate-binding protein [Aliidongia sp.]|uniref:amino acid ABC transporter substrate-binding protein n=1 Tax=Aliidongia sp. TaxID=1914230 RepID=UPI002DDD31A0|nr:amino acid ABC transporter substrate-binding protein [Aliidongia sp.]HEV2678094.1 amino acid ABC transporter substrate-binding protein [Aliidongia sp.]
MTTRAFASAAFAIGLSFGIAAPASAGPTLDTIKSKGALTCGISGATAGFAFADSQGHYSGLDVELCKGMAAAVLGSADKVKFVPLSAPQRFTALQSGEVDLLALNSTWTLGREGSLGVLFGPTIFYDGQGFMVKKASGVKSAKDLGGATICVQPGTTSELNIADYFRARNIAYKPVTIEQMDALESAFFGGRCDAYTTDASTLVGAKIKTKNPEDYVILPEVISKEPLAFMARQGDDQFYTVMRWTTFALIQAEEKGITQANVDEMLKSQDPDIKRLLGVTEGNGKALGLDEKWAYNAIKAVGNYGEIFERTVGKGSALQLDRGLNELWTKGGLMYAPPAR